MKDHLRSLPFALALTLALLAYAQATTVFDSTTMAWTAASPSSSQNSNGTTTIATSNDLNQPNTWTNQATDYFSLGSQVHNGSGIWTLTATVQQNFGGGTGERAMDLGFGNFTSTSVLQSAGTANIGGPFLVDNQGPASSNTSHGGSLSSGGSSGTLLNGICQLDTPNNPTITEGAKATYQIILNTNGPNWTLQFNVNGVPIKFNEFAADGTTLIAPDVTTLTYGANTPSINGIGLSAANYTGDTTVLSETLTNTSVAAVPEPSTWAMMVAGFAGLGFLSYRRTRRNGGFNFRFA
jgi:hypothetical protein